MSTTERRRAAVLVTVVSDYLSLVDHMTPRRGPAPDRAGARRGGRRRPRVRRPGQSGDRRRDRLDLRRPGRSRRRRPARGPGRAGAAWTRMPAGSGRSPPGLPVRVQSGLHVGAVVARRLHEGPRRYDIVGAPGAVASRLAVLAGPGDVWVSPETQRLVAPYVHTSACSPVALDSHTGPVTPFRVRGETGIATRLEASSRTGLTPYVGRQSELSTLQAHVAHAASGAGSVVAVVGEAGAGKSRLLHELHETLGTSTAGARVFRARCRAYGDGVPYGVFVQILCAALESPHLAAGAGRRRRAHSRRGRCARAVRAALPAPAVPVAATRTIPSETPARRTSPGGAARRARRAGRGAEPPCVRSSS